MIRLLSAYIKTLLILIYDRRKDISGLYLVGSETAIDQFDIILIVDADDAGTEIFSFPDPVFKRLDPVILRGIEDFSSSGSTVDHIYILLFSLKRSLLCISFLLASSYKFRIGKGG